jgi:spermidine synthase
VRLELADVGDLLRGSPGAFDAVLLDVDNGPSAFTTEGNACLYDDRGLAAANAALRPEGTMAVRSAREYRKFEQLLRNAGFRVYIQRVRARGKRGGPRHVIFLGVAPARIGPV